MCVFKGVSERRRRRKGERREIGERRICAACYRKGWRQELELVLGAQLHQCRGTVRRMLQKR